MKNPTKNFMNSLKPKFQRLKFSTWLWFSQFLVSKKPYPSVLTADETVQLIIEHHLSVARFGDGELANMINYKPTHFQKFDPKLSEELCRVAASHQQHLLICIPNIFDETQNHKLYRDSTAAFWARTVKKYTYYWKTLFPNPSYGDALITRFYMTTRDKQNAPARAAQLRQIWKGRDIIIIEGTFSRLGVGNDLFDNARSIRRILAPSQDAYSQIDHIESYLATTSKHVLFLLALGPTATVLAARLTRSGFQAIDIGHIDIEYEWLKMGATKKVPIPKKFVNEIGDGRNGRVIEGISSMDYSYQTLKRFDENK